MVKNKNIEISKALKDLFYIIFTCVFGVFSVIFSVLYLNTFNYGIIYNNINLFSAISVAIISVLTVLSIIFYALKKQIIYKISFLILVFISFFCVLMYFLTKSGFIDKVKTVEGFREYISSFGSYTAVLFILLQFLQVVVLPVPGVITVGAGVLLFGPLKGAIFSFIGIVSGSIVAFFIGRIFGYKVAKWLVGEDNLKKGLKTIKGKDKVILTFMFLFPFFPDDVMCFVAGITTVSPIFFTCMVIITRLISVFASSFSMNNSIIPYNTWWGILLWIVFFSLTVLLAIFVYKKGDKIEKFFTKRKNKKKSI